MNSQDIPKYGEKGELYCRRAVWTDVAKFFLLNIALHATTVMSSPGSSVVLTIYRTTMSMLAPFSGLAWSLQTIVYSASKLTNEVEEAHNARALCMLVPLTYWPGFKFEGEVHGQFPCRKQSRRTRLIDFFGGCGSKKNSVDVDREMRQFSVECKMAVVPNYFTVRPTRDREHGETELARNYNVVKGFAAILQICYGSFELYDSRKIQFKKYGYAAYAFIVVPYILMSFVNLIASLCQPEYPTRYLVLYGGENEGTGMVIGPSIQVNSPNDNSFASSPAPTSEQVNRDWIISVQKNVSGVVGYAYGPLKPSFKEVRAIKQRKGIFLKGNINVCICTATVPIPYLIIYFLTGFDGGRSTRWERIWTILSIVMGQVGWIIPWALNLLLRFYISKANDPAIFPSNIVFSGLMVVMGKAFWWGALVYGLLLSAAIMFSFSVVENMMLDDDICMRL